MNAVEILEEHRVIAPGRLVGRGIGSDVAELHRIGEPIHPVDRTEGGGRGDVGHDQVRAGATDTAAGVTLRIGTGRKSAECQKGEAPADERPSGPRSRRQIHVASVREEEPFPHAVVLRVPCPVCRVESGNTTAKQHANSPPRSLAGGCISHDDSDLYGQAGND